MYNRLALPALALLTVLGACDVGTTESTSARITAFTASFPAGDGCAARGDGSVLCRGVNYYGRLGIGTALEYESDPTNAIPVNSRADFHAVAVGYDHACALDADGAAWCWGSNRSGQLGVGDTAGPERCSITLSSYPTVVVGTIACATTPIKVATSKRFKSIDADADESCALTSSGELWCWGSGGDGFGLGATAPAGCTGYLCPSPIRAAPGLTFRIFDLNYYGACGTDVTFQLYCWGQQNGSGRFGRVLGVPVIWNAPTPINSSAAIRDFALGYSHTCAVTTSGALICFGSNYSGALGDGTTISRETPQQVVPPVPFVRIGVSSGYGSPASCALDQAGKAWCWGANGSGQLGTGNTLPARSPQPVLGDLSFNDISLGGPICGTRSDGIWCWGQLPSRFEQ